MSLVVFWIISHCLCCFIPFGRNCLLETLRKIHITKLSQQVNMFVTWIYFCFLKASLRESQNLRLLPVRSLQLLFVVVVVFPRTLVLPSCSAACFAQFAHLGHRNSFPWKTTLEICSLKISQHYRKDGKKTFRRKGWVFGILHLKNRPFTNWTHWR